MILPVNSAQILWHVVHDLLGMKVVVAQQVNVIILPGQRAMLGPVVLGRVHLEGFDSLRAVGDTGQRTVLLHRVLVPVSVDLPRIMQPMLYSKSKPHHLPVPSTGIGTSPNLSYCTERINVHGIWVSTEQYIMIIKFLLKAFPNYARFNRHQRPFT
jgi:hypothetical protein